jgi:hypothetical protein
MQATLHTLPSWRRLLLLFLLLLLLVGAEPWPLAGRRLFHTCDNNVVVTLAAAADENDVVVNASCGRSRRCALPLTRRCWRWCCCFSCGCGCLLLLGL